MSFSIIAAVGKNRELGKRGELCFHLREDMKFFKKTTMGHPVVMGRKTFESLPGFLPGREHIIISQRSPEKIFNDFVNAKYSDRKLTEDARDNFNVIYDPDFFIQSAKNSEAEYFVIGGGSIYEMFLPHSDKMYLTEVEANDADADVFFPEFKRDDFSRTVIESHEENGIIYNIVEYKRKDSL